MRSVGLDPESLFLAAANAEGTVLVLEVVEGKGELKQVLRKKGLGPKVGGGGLE